MSRLLTDSFELDIEFPEFHPRWTATSTGFARPGIDATSLIDGVRCVSFGGPTAFLYKDIDSVTEIYAAMWFRFIAAPNTLGSFFLWQTTTGSVTLGYVGVQNSVLVVSADGTTVAATGTRSLTAGTNYHMQVYVNYADVGSIVVKLDDNVEITYAGDTKPGVIADITRVAITGATSNTTYIDTICVNSTAGTVDNSWPGVVRMKLLTPAGPGTYVNNWSRNAGATNWQAVDEVPNDGDTTYLYTSTANVYESFSMTDPGLTSVNYQALITSSIAKKDSGTVQLAVGIVDDDNATNYYVANSALGTSYGIVEGRLTLDPSTGSAWTPSGINATQALIVSTSG